MNPFSRYTLALLPVLALCAVAADTTGCANTATANTCVITPYISPTAVTLDHTQTGAANAQLFKTGYLYTGHCAIPVAEVPYFWNVSDTIDATVASDGTVSCINASLSPITVYSTTMGVTGNPPVTIYTPTNLPTATLTCK